MEVKPFLQGFFILLLTTPAFSLAGTFIDRNDVGGTCPSPTHQWGNTCCCANGCCWDGCPKDPPPENCLDGVPNSQWVYNQDKAIYLAVKNLKVQGCNKYGSILPLKCMGIAKSVPKSLLRVKVWYDNGFLQDDKIKTHDKAKNWIYATIAHVQHFMCSSTLGTFLETELVDIEYMKNKHFKGTKYQSLPDMQPVIEKDNSVVDIHLAFINNCDGGRANTGQLCKVHPLAVNCIGPSTTPLSMAEIVTHEMGHVLGMKEDEDVGCGKHNGDYGHMSDWSVTHDRWSSCSMRAYLEQYNYLEPRKKWCLKPAKSNACRKTQTSVTGLKDVGFGGQCPSPSYKHGKSCCCGNSCCWNKCTWDNPPDSCLDGLYKGQWLFDTNKGYYTAVKYWQGSVLDCNGKIKPKSCIVETLLIGPKDVGGTCPSPSRKFNDHCVCADGCNWNGCPFDPPPKNCLNGVPNSQWVKNPKKDNWIAVRNKKG